METNLTEYAIFFAFYQKCQPPLCLRMYRAKIKITFVSISNRFPLVYRYNIQIQYIVFILLLYGTIFM